MSVKRFRRQPELSWVIRLDSDRTSSASGGFSNRHF
jgi:hypothetical protein